MSRSGRSISLKQLIWATFLVACALASIAYLETGFVGIPVLITILAGVVSWILAECEPVKFRLRLSVAYSACAMLFSVALWSYHTANYVDAFADNQHAWGDEFAFRIVSFSFALLFLGLYRLLPPLQEEPEKSNGRASLTSDLPDAPE